MFNLLVGAAHINQQTYLAAIIAQFQLMKQTKMKSFVQLIGKIHEINSDAHRPIKQNQHYDKSRKCTRERHKCSITVNFAEAEGRTQPARNQDNAEATQQNNQVGIYFMQQSSVKGRYDDKKTLYQLYRDSLRSKKSCQIGLPNSLTKRDTFRRAEDELQRAHQMALSMNPSQRLKSRRESHTYQKILRKKSVMLSNNSISIFPQESQSVGINKSQSEPPPEAGKIDGSESMRGRKLNYKPIFRIKKLNLENCRTEAESHTHHQLSKMDNHPLSKDNHPLSKKCINLKTEIIDSDPKISSFRHRLEEKQKFRLLLKNNEKFTAWEHDRYEQQQLCRILL